MLLRLGRHFTGKRTWTRAHMNWLMSQKLAHREQRIAFEEMLLGGAAAEERVTGSSGRSSRVPDWSLAKVVTALQAMRGIDLVSATILLAEIGDLSRFANPRQLMAYLGLVPTEESTGDRSTAAASPRPATVGRGAFWSNPPGAIGIPHVCREKKHAKVAAAPRAVHEIAWKAHER